LGQPGKVGAKIEKLLPSPCFFYDDDGYDDDGNAYFWKRGRTPATPSLPPLSEVGQINIKFGEKFSTRLAAFPGFQFLAIEIGFYGAT